MSKRAKKHPRFVLYRNPRNGTIVIAEWYRVRPRSDGQIVRLVPIVELDPDGGAEPGNYNYDRDCHGQYVTELPVADLLAEADQFADAVAKGLSLSASPLAAA